ncbi:Hypothetical protein, putative [Bodo saltans]|uniref:Uncharacterized protein n=1 Tax=Bodo saltans TaxID=75058 RepID=A0A0S4J8E9_BODSA|nr:Hypothetical protein, putative [Bodo saltans]|eukprot:CUG83831.1 Hypothetical protein, putative [Bodo saltans]
MTEVALVNPMDHVLVRRSPSSEETRRPLDFNETLPMEIDNATAQADHSEEWHKADGVPTSPSQGAASRHHTLPEAAGTPSTTRKRAPPMSLDRYAQLRSMLLNRRQQRNQSHDAILRDTELCNAASHAIEADALPHALSRWSDRYDTLLSALERSPATKSFLTSRTGGSPVGLPKSSAALQDSSPSAVSKSLKPMLDAIDRFEVRRVEYSNVQSLERKLHLAQDQAALRLQSFHDEKLMMEHQLQSVQTETRQHHRRKDQIEGDLIDMQSEETLTEELRNSSATLAQLQTTLETHSAATALAKSTHASNLTALTELTGRCTELQKELQHVMRVTVLDEEEPRSRGRLEAEAAAARQELVTGMLRAAVSVSQMRADQTFERLSTQLSELQRLSSCEQLLPPAGERLAGLRKEREHAAAEIRELNSAMHELDEAIADLATSLPDGVVEAQVSEDEVRIASANVRALELILERRRDVLDAASASEEERREINSWLQGGSAPIPVMFAEVEGAADHLNRYRTLQRQCLLLGNELSSVHTQQREQQEFTSLGLYHTLEDDVADAKEAVQALDDDETSLTVSVEDTLRKETLTNEARVAIVQEESTASAEVDALRDEELSVLAEVASLRVRLLGLQSDESSLVEEERAHQAERHRRYLMSLGVLSSSAQGAPSNDQHAPIVRASVVPRRQLRSREEVLAGASVITVLPSTSHILPPQQRTSTSTGGGSWWWPWSSRGNAPPRPSGGTDNV